jgi:hypothetical protein
MAAGRGRVVDRSIDRLTRTLLRASYSARSKRQRMQPEKTMQCINYASRCDPIRARELAEEQNTISP